MLLRFIKIGAMKPEPIADATEPINETRAAQVASSSGDETIDTAALRLGLMIWLRILVRNISISRAPKSVPTKNGIRTQSAVCAQNPSKRARRLERVSARTPACSPKTTAARYCAALTAEIWICDEPIWARYTI